MKGAVGGAACVWPPGRVVAWALVRRGGPWILRLGEPGQQRVRLAAGMLDTAVGAIGVAVLGLQLWDVDVPGIPQAALRSIATNHP